MSKNQKGFMQISTLLATVFGAIIVVGGSYIILRPSPNDIVIEPGASDSSDNLAAVSDVAPPVEPEDPSDDDVKEEEAEEDDGIASELEELKQQLAQEQQKQKELADQVAQALQASEPDPEPEEPEPVTPPAQSSGSGTFTTPSGAIVDQFGNIITEAPEENQTSNQSDLSSTQVANLVSPSVVKITTDDGTGSGFVISSEGTKFILTNAHVVGSNSSVAIKTEGGLQFSGAVIGRDDFIDLALVSTKGNNIPSLTLGNSQSSSLSVGEDLYALGFPFSQADVTLKEGTLSAKQVIDGDDMLKTDISINSGNSGGPLVDDDGEVVGINTSEVTGGNNVGYAIPVDVAKSLIPDLIDGLENTIFVTPPDGSTVDIPQSMTVSISFNPTLTCKQLGFSGNKVSLCELYKDHADSGVYEWNVLID